jgi:hypothetical protein
MGLDILGWPPIPARSLNQKTSPKEIPFESVKRHPALNAASMNRLKDDFIGFLQTNKMLKHHSEAE